MRSSRRRIRVALSVCAVAAAIVFAAVMANVYRQGSLEEVRSADAIVVLGASQWNGAPSPVFRARLDNALQLYKGGYAPLIILTGGKGAGDAVSESQAGKEYLMRRGIDGSVILIEEQSRTTLQNLRYTAALLRGRNLNTILLVSHDFHMMRAKAMAIDLGMTAFSAPVKTKNGIEKFKYSAREAWVYLLFLVFNV